ncbi:MAG TPA: cytochrome P450 [Anaerolineaceae bacterium]|nr:cytochrome P450 [Anaerolineaceae bacterium]
MNATAQKKRAPGPLGLPVLGNVRDFSTDVLQDFLNLHRRYGDVVRLTFATRVSHFVFGPDAIKHILQDNNKNYIKGRSLYKARPLLGNGLLTSEGDFWRRQRRLMQPMFHRSQIETFIPEMTAATAQMLDRWQALTGREQPFDAAREMMRLTLAIVTRTMFGANLLPEEADTVAEVMPRLMHETNLRIISLTSLREKLPLPSNRAFHHDIERLNQILYRIIDERRRSGPSRDDLLGRLMSATSEDSTAMSDRQLRDELMTIFLAGHETTAALLSWTLYLLSKNPAERSRLQAEVDQVLAGRIPAAGDLERLAFTGWVLQESLRLYPPAWSIARQAIGDDELAGYHIPAGSGIIISPYVVHRRPDCWDNPEAFDPERFAPEREARQSHYAYLPFGGGPRLCIGSNFALQEAALALAMMTQKFELDLDPDHPVVPMTDFTLRPAAGVWMRLRPRNLSPGFSV